MINVGEMKPPFRGDDRRGEVLEHGALNRTINYVLFF